MWRLASMRSTFREPERRDRADGGERPDHPMERIFVPEEAFEAIKATLPMGRVASRAGDHHGLAPGSGWRGSGSTSRRAVR